jgi:tetratricopeptide (TPR) repeat protein
MRPSSGSRFRLHADSGVSEAESRRLTRLAWLLAALLGVVLLVVAFRFHRVGDYGAETDFYGGYANGALALQHGHLDAARYGVVGPGYEIALALVGFVVRDLFRAAELISALAMVATLLLWFGLLSRRANVRLAFFTALVLATNGQFFRYGYAVTTDALALALQAGSLYLLLARPGTRGALGAGLLAAAAFLTRYNAIVLVPVGVLAALLGGRSARDSAASVAAGAVARATRLREALVFSAAFAVPVGAWLVWCLAHGATFASQLHHNLAYEVFARARGIPWDAYQRDMQSTFHSLGDVIARDPGAVARQLIVNCGSHLIEDARLLLGWPIAVCAAIGVVIAAGGGGLRCQWPLVLAGAFSFLALVPVFHSERYSLSVLPYYAMLAGAAFASPRFALVLGQARRIRLKPVLAAIPLGLALAGSIRLQRQALADQPTEVLEVAETLKGLRQPGDRLIARKPHVAWLAGVEAVPFPFAQTIEGLAQDAHRRHARWLLYSSPELSERPWYRHLLDTSAVVPGLTARRVARGHPAVLYEIGPAFGTRPAWAADSVLVMLYDARARLIDHPRDVNLLGLAGTIELERGMLGHAREHLERAADLAPQDPHILLPLGDAMLRSGDLKLAALAYGRAEQVSPGNAAARIGRGWASLLAGDRQQAAELWRPVIGATREPATLQRMLELYRSLGDAAAVAEVERSLAGSSGGRAR